MGPGFVPGWGSSTHTFGFCHSLITGNADQEFPYSVLFARLGTRVETIIELNAYPYSYNEPTKHVLVDNYSILCLADK